MLRAAAEDPSTAGGFRVLYDREVSVEVREDNAVGKLQAVKAKILILGAEDDPEVVRFEASSEDDLFFHFYHSLDRQGFQEFRRRQNLLIDFADFPNVFIRMLNHCIKEPHCYMSVMYINGGDDTARLDFVQNMEYKFVELLTVDFVKSPDELAKQHVSFRYSNLKNKLHSLQAQLNEVLQLVKLKNPSLLLQLQKLHNSPLKLK